MRSKKSFQIWKKRAWFSKKKLIGYILFVGFFFLLFFGFSIKKTECLCDGLSCQQQVCDEIKKNIPKSIFILNSNKVKNKLTQLSHYKNIDIKFVFPQKIQVKLADIDSSLIFNITLVDRKPSLSIDLPPVSSESSPVYNKPGVDLANQHDQYQYLTVQVYADGHHQTVASASSNITAFIHQKKNDDWFEKAYQRIQAVLMYRQADQVYILDNDLYFITLNQPDLIVSLVSEEDNLLKALQSLGFLTTIKQDSKIIDLRYANPIIR